LELPHPSKTLGIKPIQSSSNRKLGGRASSALGVCRSGLGVSLAGKRKSRRHDPLHRRRYHHENLHQNRRQAQRRPAHSLPHHHGRSSRAGRCCGLRGTSYPGGQMVRRILPPKGLRRADRRRGVKIHSSPTPRSWAIIIFLGAHLTQNPN